MSKARFRSHPRPDDEVVSLLEKVLESARNGYVRSVVIVAVNPVNKAETGIAGDLGEIRSTVLAGGMARASAQIIKERQ